MESNANSKEFSPQTLSKQTLLELGCGCGMVGLSYAMRGCPVVHMTDLQEVIDTITNINVEVLYVSQ